MHDSELQVDIIICEYILDDEYISIQLHRWKKEIITKTKCNPGVSFYNAEERQVLCRIVLNKYTAKYLTVVYP